MAYVRGGGGPGLWLHGCVHDALEVGEGADYLVSVAGCGDGLLPGFLVVGLTPFRGFHLYAEQAGGGEEEEVGDARREPFRLEDACLCALHPCAVGDGHEEEPAVAVGVAVPADASALELALRVGDGRAAFLLPGDQGEVLLACHGCGDPHFLPSFSFHPARNAS